MKTQLNVLTSATNKSMKTGEVFSYLVSYLDGTEVHQIFVRDGLHADLVDLPFTGKSIPCLCEFRLSPRKDKAGYALSAFEVVSLSPLKEKVSS